MTAHIAEDDMIYAGDEFPFHPSLLKPRIVRPGSTKEEPYVCALCGKKIRNIDVCTWVEVVDWGVVREQDGRDFSWTDDEGYLGLWPVGKKCAKKLHPTVRAYIHP